MVKIRPVNHEIMLLKGLFKKEINASRTHVATTHAMGQA